MGYWDEVRDVIKKGYDLALEEVRESAETVFDTGKKGISYAQYQKELFFEQRKLQELLADLGDQVYDLYKEKKDIYADEKVKELTEQVAEAEKKCRDLEKEIEKL